jgi:hypothetical protein
LAPDTKGPTIMNPAIPSVITSRPLTPFLTASRTPTARTRSQTQVGAGMKPRKTNETNTTTKPMTLLTGSSRTVLAIFTRPCESLGGYRLSTLRA